MARRYFAGEYEGCAALYRSTGRVVSFLMGTAGGFCVVASVPFLRVWTHGTVDADQWVLWLMLAGMAVAAPAQSSLTLLRFVDVARPLAIAWLSQAVLGVVFAVILIPRYGVAGAAAGFAILEAIAIGLYLPFVVERRFGFAAVPFLISGWGIALGSFAFSYAAGWIGFSIGLPGLQGIFVAGVCWAAIVGVPILYVILPKARRTALLQRLRIPIRVAPAAGPINHLPAD
jgi:O-antigen/teichoic acid export membrane protein